MDPCQCQPQYKIGDRVLCKDDCVAMQIVSAATDSDIPRVKSKVSRRRIGFGSRGSDAVSICFFFLWGVIVRAELAEKLRKAGKGVKEAVAELYSSKDVKPGLLHIAAGAGRLEMCKFLIKDLDVNAPAGDKSAKPLLYATFGTGSTSVLRCLLDRGANPNKENKNGTTALHYVSAMLGADFSTEATMLRGATTRGDPCQMAELLLSRRAYVDPINNRGTPLHVAAENGNVRMLELLLRHQANPNRVVRLFYTPLTLALFASSLKCVELLIKAGADVNAGRPVTPLVIAATYGLTDCIKCLLEAGADATIPDEFGRTPKEIAAIQGWKECVDILSPPMCPVARFTGSDDPLLDESDGCSLDGDAAFKQKDYAHAVALYTKQWRLTMMIQPCMPRGASAGCI
ncbi:ankyrin-3-like isoform X3 [Brachypodium distachyon]|uniref:ankyrin-3-like isoform X3 n=1 Tax=Brachypodium distachyon TaxID=15368 RepID=UPI000D0DAC26|nr:ankyrin-3-like isoform X3 [Brachypodium distachyon]|eukprot:XP_024312760.1 ankyrin-3-like isoform X3 [Brachypodium distachyon]